MNLSFGIGIGIGISASTIGASAPGVTVDPYWANVVLLAGFNGADSAVAYTEESTSARVATFAGNAKLSTAGTPRYGSAHLALDGTGDYVTFPDSPDWNFGGGQFTVEGTFKFHAQPSNAILVMSWDAVVSSFSLMCEANSLIFKGWDGANRASTPYAFTPTLDVPYHIAADRDASSVLRLYVNGVMVSKDAWNYVLLDAPQPLSIGSLTPSGSPGAYDLNGWVDELRITKGVARYASDAGFAAPTTAYPRA